MEGPKGNPVRAAWLVFKWKNSELTEEETKEILALDPLFPWRKRPPRDEEMRRFRMRRLSPIQNRRQNMMTKPRTMKQVLLDDVKADPNDPRVARVLEILERKRVGRVPNEQNAEYRKFMGELIEEARAKGKPV